MRSNHVMQNNGARLHRVAAVLAVAGGMTPLVFAFTGKTSAYADDTHAALRSATRVVSVRGEQKHETLNAPPPVGKKSMALDTRRAVFTVANSRNPQPTVAQDCSHGPLPVNRYPLMIEQQERSAVVGGLFLSRVPQSTEWLVTYCNSAVIMFKDAPNGVVDGVRIAGAWDAIRAGRHSPNLLITNSWISNARDDAIENDYLQATTIRDTLIDGAFQGISVKSRKGSNSSPATDEIVTLSGVLLKLREYGYKEDRRFGALAKSDERSPRIKVVNSIVAVDYAGGLSFPQYWATSWSKLTGSSKNLFLWLSDSPIPHFVPLPPSSFRVLKGRVAREAWTRAKVNWINCHPKVARLSSDRRSNPDACVPGTWGGFTT